MTDGEAAFLRLTFEKQGAREKTAHFSKVFSLERNDKHP